MGTLGVKIIDGDLAIDLYYDIIDLYESGASIETIREKIPFKKYDYDADADFYHEIFVTTYALTFWEIGELTDDILIEVKRVIDLKAGVKIWTEEHSEDLGKKRQKELNKLLKKISGPNKKIRPRKKHSIIKNLYFEPDDVLTFQLSDKKYYAVICAKVTQEQGQCTYDLVATTYNGKSKPTIDDLKDCFIVGRRIVASYDPKTTLLHQPNVDEIWRYVKQDNFFVGLSYHLVTHKDITSFKDKFEVIGKLKIKESFKDGASISYASSFNKFKSIFSNLKKHMDMTVEEKFPVTILCELKQPKSLSKTSTKKRQG